MKLLPAINFSIILMLTVAIIVMLVKIDNLEERVDTVEITKMNGWGND